MREWAGFLALNRWMLNFGFLFNFFSSFGQTFFISIYVPSWIMAFGLSNAGFGSLYAGVTLAAAVCLSVFGKYVDRMPVNTFGLIVLSCLLSSVLILSLSADIFSFTLGLFLVRWLGQGLMAHTSEAGMAKSFTSGRGKALGFSALGHPSGQFLLPLMVVPLLERVGWRMSLIYMAVAAALIMGPLMLSVHRKRIFNLDAAGKPASGVGGNAHLRRGEFWLISINTIMIPLVCTTVFIYQYMMGVDRGWCPSWIAFSFAFYAAFNAASMIVSGHLIDRFCGRLIFPLYLIPAFLGLIFVAVIDSVWVTPVFYSLLGISTGLGSTVKTAVQAEIFGTENIGRIRAHMATLMVFSTAVGPPIAGLLIDRGLSYEHIMLAFAAIVFGAIMLSKRLD
jgi:MFS family permease